MMFELNKEFDITLVSGIGIEDRNILIIDDFGYRNDEISDGFLNLNIKLTCAVIPGHAYSTTFSKKASEKGFEIIVHMPMENSGDNRGEENFVLLRDLDSVLVRDRIRTAFEQIPQAIGMNNHQGSKATENLQLMKYVARSLKKKDKYFLKIIFHLLVYLIILLHGYVLNKNYHMIFFEVLNEV